MAFSTAGKNAMLNHIGSVAGFASLHTADPGDSGASEVSGGAYARQAVTWAAASAGNLDSSNTPAFDVPGGTTVSHAGFWSAATGGTFYGGNALSASETFTANGTYTLSDADLSLS